MGEAPDLREQECPGADVCLNMCDLHPPVEPTYCPFKGRCAHVACLIDVDQCASALMASVTTPPGSTVGGDGG